MKIGIIACLSIGVAWALLAITQLWAPVLSGEFFVKITITAGVAIGVILIVALAIREYITDQKLKSKDFID
jgi:uncharacterized protein (DUF2062 family)